MTAASRPPRVTSTRPMIQVIDLHKTFGEYKVLTGINVTVPEGSTCVILGGSGSGKTVLMKHMIGLLKPDHGQVIIDGEDIVPLGEDRLEVVRRKFGMVFQAAALFDSMNVYDNVAFPLREHRKQLSEEQVRTLVRAKLDLMGLPRTAEAKFHGNRFGLLICDECHHLPAPSYRFIAEGSLAPYRLGLSATLERADGGERVCEELLGPRVYRA
ncbi:ATP-binding cassette domain-containing protein, partial [Stigmatella aurantiaca]|uniref:ATP-binding cassette domain-containing protein n=1 Tax=Stigmatella aurantiaca TaxID=41 RepID=UPI000AE62F20